MRYEYIKVLAQRYYRIIFLIIASLNVFLCYYDCVSSPEYEKEQLFESHNATVEQLYSDPIYNVDSLQNNDIPNEIMAYLLQDMSQYADYKNDIKNLLTETDVLLENNTSNSMYLSDVYKRYSTLYNTVEIGFEHYKGWDIFIDCQWPAILTLIFNVLIAGMFFGNEKNIYEILHTTPYGQVHLGIKKILALLLHIIVTLGLFMGMEFLIVSANIGFSNPLNAIQSFDEYVFCPYDISIIEMFIIVCAIRILVIFVFCLFFVVLSNVVTSQIAIASAGIISLIINIFLLLASSHMTDSVMYITNIFISCVGTVFFKRYRAVNLYNFLVPIINIYLVILVLAAFLLGGISVYIYAKGSYGKHSVSLWNKNSVSGKKNRKTTRLSKPKYRIRSLFYYELTKILYSKSIIVFVFFILLSQILYSFIYYSSAHDGEDKIWQVYLETLEGEYTSEKHQYVLNEYDYITEILQDYDKYCDEYKFGNITYEEFDNYINEYTYADARKEVIVLLNNYCEYLQELSNKQKAFFVYDTGWVSCLTNHSDILSLILIIYISCFLYNYEIKQDNQISEMTTIISTCKYGRKYTMKIKLMLIVFTAVVILSIQYIVNTIICFCYWYLPAGNISMNSIMCFSSLPSVNIITYYIASYFMKLFVVLTFGVISYVAMCLLKKVPLVYIVNLILIGLPMVCSLLGITTFNYISPMVIYLSSTYIIDFTFNDVNIYILSTCAVYFTITSSILLYTYKRSEMKVL